MKKKLSDMQRRVLEYGETEAPFSGELLYNKNKGIYLCANCGNEIFSSETKFDSGSGWPSFYEVISNDKIKLKKDKSLGVNRIEVICKKCGGHLGHFFQDAPQTPTGKRYCINSVALEFKKEER